MLAGAVLAGGGAHDTFEHPVEVAHVGEAHVQGDLLETEGGGLEDTFQDLLDAVTVEIVQEADAHLAAEELAGIIGLMPMSLATMFRVSSLRKLASTMASIWRT